MTSMPPLQQPIPYTAIPPPQQQQPNNQSLSPISPVAPATITSPFSEFDIFSSLPPSNPTKTTKDSFFPAASPLKTIQQMQMEKQVSFN